MAIPGYETYLLPILELAADGRTRTSRDAIEAMAGVFGISADERKQLLPSGRTPLFNNRVHWALTYLRHALLIEAPGYGRFVITDRGRTLLKTKPGALSRKALMAMYPELAAFVGAAGSQTGAEAPSVATPSAEGGALSPEETLESIHSQLRHQIESELLERLRNGDPTFFEKAVLDVLVGMGYGGSRLDASSHLGGTGDEGLDGVINEDRLGLDKVFVQAKRHKATVGRPDVQSFAGSLEGAHARKGVMITTSTFSPDARAYVAKIEKTIVLVDGPQLASFMVEYEIGVQRKAEYPLYRIDDDFFEPVEG